ncbi:unnamed protein product [Enterobius vermicularis]|uniref:ATP synthase F1 subunit epsilon n=1 Tax=Enterobius vermicularis TaxID=51028 RepID=A0A0N4VE09_ENTVE|nr:unnamed protein product [Enterobius vermicularis]
MALRSAKLCSLWNKHFVRCIGFGELGSGSGKQLEQLALLRKEIEKEVEHHEKQKKTHEDAVARHKRRIAELEEQEKKWRE